MEECPICYESSSPDCTLECDHAFCFKCLNSVIEYDLQSKLKCPLCRGLSYNILNKYITHKIFKIELERNPRWEAIKAYFARLGLRITIVVIDESCKAGYYTAKWYFFANTPNPHDRISYKIFRNLKIRNMNVISTSYSN